MKLEYTVKSNEYVNVNEVLKAEFNISARLLSKLKHEQKIFLNDKKAFISARLNPNDRILVDMNINETSENILAIEMDLKIIYEDEYFLILNKPANLPVHPSMSHYSNSLSNGVKFYFEKHNLNIKMRPVNRLDKDTSGIVIFAKHPYIQESLVSQMKSKEFQKYYLGLVEGFFEPESGSIIAPITRKDNSIIERTINLSSTLEKEQAITHYKTIEKLKNSSLVEFNLETGRTHQIRVHCKYKKHPLIGDTLYGNNSDLISHQALHAYKVSFYHPITKKLLEFKADLPDDFSQLYNKLN